MQFSKKMRKIDLKTRESLICTENLLYKIGTSRHIRSNKVIYAKQAQSYSQTPQQQISNKKRIVSCITEMM